MTGGSAQAVANAQKLITTGSRGPGGVSALRPRPRHRADRGAVVHAGRFRRVRQRDLVLASTARGLPATTRTLPERLPIDAGHSKAEAEGAHVRANNPIPDASRQR